MQTQMKIQLDTLSLLHIGNGTFLQKGTDFIVENGLLHVVNLDKLAAVLNFDQDLIQQWSDAIVRNNSEAFIRAHLGSSSLEGISKRVVASRISFDRRQTTLKEYIHDGLGRPYVPGSSLKGSIRTAVMATLARPRVAPLIEEREKALQALAQEPKSEKEMKELQSDVWRHFRDNLLKMEKTVLGASPEKSLFRYLSTGDAFFEKGIEMAVMQINLNIRKRSSLLDDSKQQPIEVIPSGVRSSFRMNVKPEFLNRLGLATADRLFLLINDHTRDLVESEIAFWQEGDGCSYTDKDQYLAELNKVLEVVRSCKSGECVLRIGQASGWRFVTGAWLEELKRLDKTSFEREIVNLARRKNREFYSDYPFPKSRRIDSESHLIGFVKLKIS